MVERGIISKIKKARKSVLTTQKWKILNENNTDNSTIIRNDARALNIVEFSFLAAAFI